MNFFLGSHHATQRWFDLAVPLFVSRRVLTGRKQLPGPCAGWALDSGGFTELSLYGGWQTTEREYIADVLRFEQMGRLLWVAPQDWMCEPHIVEKTRLSVQFHQKLTVENFLRLREELGELVIPVLQGWTPDDYLHCWGHYENEGVDLDAEPLVGVGSVCRRQNTAEAGMIFRRLWGEGLNLHGFGVKITGLESYADCLASADSMAWSLTARNQPPLPGCPHKSCANCSRFAMRWRDNLLARLGQQRLELAA